MKKIRLSRRLTALVIAMMICIGAFIPASAENVSYSFNLENTDTSFNRYTGGSNTKVYSGDPATVRTYTNNAPGYGFAFIMQYKGVFSYKSATVSSPRYWLSGAGITYPVYASGENITGRAYYVAARIDNDYNGTYSCTGYFNSDWVS